MNSEHIRVFRQYLKDRDVRMTSERLRIAKQIASFHALFTADHVRDSLPTVSRATIYRTLNLLVDAGLLNHLILKDGAQVYSASSIVAEGKKPRLTKLAKRALKYGQLCAASHRAVIVGTCPWCGTAIIPGKGPSEWVD